MNKKVISVILVLMIVLVGCGKQEKLSDKDLEKYGNLSQTVIKYAVNNDYDNFIKMCNETMYNAIDKGQFEEMVKLVNEKGKIVEFKENDGIYFTDKETNEKLITIVQKVSHENGDRTYTVSFNEDDKLSGFYVK